MPKLPRLALCLLGGLALLGLVPRPAEAQTVPYCDGRLLGMNFSFSSRPINASNTELRIHMVLRNMTQSAIFHRVRSEVPWNTSPDVNRWTPLAAGAQRNVLLGIHELHPDTVSDTMRDGGVAWIIMVAKVDC